MEPRSPDVEPKCPFWRGWNLPPPDLGAKNPGSLAGETGVRIECPNSDREQGQPYTVAVVLS